MNVQKNEVEFCCPFVCKKLSCLKVQTIAKLIRSSCIYETKEIFLGYFSFHNALTALFRR